MTPSLSAVSSKASAPVTPCGQSEGCGRLRSRYWQIALESAIREGQKQTDPTIADLRSEYDAIVLAVGALVHRDLGVDGSELDGVHLAMDYLSQHNRLVAKAEGRHAWPAPDDRITAKGKRVSLGESAQGRGFIGIRRNGAYQVTSLDQRPLLPAWLALLLIVGSLLLAWKMEGR